MFPNNEFGNLYSSLFADVKFSFPLIAHWIVTFKVRDYILKILAINLFKQDGQIKLSQHFYNFTEIL